MRDWRPDWCEEASRKLANSKLSAADREEISRELAGYLDDLCSDAPSRGLDDSAAAETAAAELHEDKHLGANLHRARKENAMNLNERTKRFWLPGLTILLASAAFLAVLQLAGFRPYFRTLWLSGGPVSPYSVYGYISMYVAWLCVLPFLGAAGAYWSRRQGSGRAVQTAAGLFPVLVFLAIFLVMLPFNFALDGAPAAKMFLPDLAGAVLSWVVIPGAALLLGILPFLRGSSAQRRTV